MKFRVTLSTDAVTRPGLDQPKFPALSDMTNYLGSGGQLWTTGATPSVSPTTGSFSRILRGSVFAGFPDVKYSIGYNLTVSGLTGGANTVQFYIRLYNDTFSDYEQEAVSFNTNGAKSGTVDITPDFTPRWIGFVASKAGGAGGQIQIDSYTAVADLAAGDTIPADSQVISEPGGLREGTLVLERHPEFHSLIESFDGDLVFYGSNGEVDGGVNFIREKVALLGPDATIKILIEIAIDDITYHTLFNGLLDLAGKEELWDNTITCPLIRDDLWSRFISRLEVPVDLQDSEDLDGGGVNVFEAVNVNMKAQRLKQIYYAIEDVGNMIPMDEEYIQYIPGFIELDELQSTFILPQATNSEKPVWFFEALYDGPIEIDFRIEYSKTTILDGSGHTGARTIYDFWFQLNDEAPVEFSYSSGAYTDADVYQNWGIGNPPGDNSIETTIATYVASLDLKKGDVIRVYLQRDAATDNNITFWGTQGLFADKTDSFALKSPHVLGMVDVPTYFRLTQQTEYPATNSEGVLVHDAAGSIIDRITAQSDIFYSELLGSLFTKYRQYTSNGCAWFYALLKGLQIRLYTLLEKPFFLSFKDFWDGINPILNLGLGYETIDPSEQDEPTVGTFDDEQNLGAGEDWTLALIPLRYEVTPPAFGSSKLLAFEIFGGVQGATYEIGYDITLNDTLATRIALWDATLSQTVSELKLLAAGNHQGTVSLVPGFVPKYVTFRTASLGDGSATWAVLPFTFNVIMPASNPQQVIRIEEKRHWYDDSQTSVDFSHVQNITKVYDREYQFNQIEIGYQKWNAEDVSGLDDPQTKRTYSSIFKRIGQKLTLFSKFIAASLTIEVTRRTTREKSADYKYDNDVFIIALNPSPIEIDPETSPDLVDFQPEQDENFVSVSNLENSDTRYNMRLTPARNLLRWLNYVSGCLQFYTDSAFKFVSGEGNYDMESAMADSSPECVDDADNAGEVLSEKQNIGISPDYLFIPEPLQIADMPLEIEDYRAIVDNRKLAIGISQTGDDHAKCFIKTLEYKFMEASCDLTAWPKEEFDIQVIETIPAIDCKPRTQDTDEDEECFMVLETGEALLTEVNELMELETC